MENELQKEIALTVEGSIATIMVNRPSVFNALDTKLLYKMNDLLDTVENNKSIRALIITGGGEKSFVSGANIRDLKEMSVAAAKLSIEVGYKVFTRIELLPLPTVAVINGHCLGGGLELAMCCDVRVCSRNAKIGQPEINIGMIPGWGCTLRLPKIVGLGRAKEMILLGKLLDADTAKTYGLVSEVYDSVEAVRTEGLKIAEKLASLPPHVIALDKQLVANAQLGPTEQYKTQDSLALAYCFTTRDSHEGLNAFLEKRKAIFKGE